ncbi:MAG TPA: FTR1 family protein [Burkholderiales bacterium]|nr:FTR1 family protein [Burkholderiales bacterium]
MLGSAIVVFRETLEAALIVAIVLGATRGVAGRGRWIAGGVVLGLVGALLVAAFAGAISEAVQGRGQELFNAGVLLVAVAMLAWHNVWMSSHARKHVAEMRHLGHDVSVGAKPLSAMLAVTAVAVLREGSETVLFLYGLAASGGSAGLALGGVLGLIGGTAIGALLYFGLLRVPLRYFFTVTGAIVLLLASGLAASAAGFLVQAGLLPTLVNQVWDTSAILNVGSFAGRMLHVLVGYNDRPTGIELLFYVVTLVTILVLMRVFGARSTRAARTEAAKQGAPA